LAAGCRLPRCWLRCRPSARWAASRGYAGPAQFGARQSRRAGQGPAAELHRDHTRNRFQGAHAGGAGREPAGVPLLEEDQVCRWREDAENLGLQAWRQCRDRRPARTGWFAGRGEGPCGSPAAAARVGRLPHSLEEAARLHEHPKPEILQDLMRRPLVVGLNPCSLEGPAVATILKKRDELVHRKPGFANQRPKGFLWPVPYGLERKGVCAADRRAGE